MHRLGWLGASCLLHVTLVGGSIVLGLGSAASREVKVLIAEIVPAEPVQALEPPRLLARPPAPARPVRTPASRPAADDVVRQKPTVEPSPPVTAAVPAPTPVIAAPASPPEPIPPPPTPSTALAGAMSSPAAPVQSSAPPAIGRESGQGPEASRPAQGASSGPGPTALATGSGITQVAIPRGGYQVQPAYPASARRLGIQGTTTLRVYVALDGRIGDVVVERTAGHPDLDQAAADAIRRWRFEPARRGTEAVGMWVLLPVEFRLK